MPELFEVYSVTEIITFIIMLALALKGFIDFYDWAKARINKVVQSRVDEQKDQEKTTHAISDNNGSIKELSESQMEMSKQLQQLTNSIQVLIDSDKDDIKSWITEKHHYFVYEKKYIDDYSLDCIEKRYKHYTDEGGNSFILDLMKEIRALPKISTQSNNNENNK